MSKRIPKNFFPSETESYRKEQLKDTRVGLIIDGEKVWVPEGSTVLDAAREISKDIPTLCHHPKLSVSGSCRMCLVEVDQRGLQTSCSTIVQEDMVVHTETERVIAGRKQALKLLLSDHPLDCLTCEMAGNCKLQDYAYRYQVTGTEIEGRQRGYLDDDSNPFIYREFDKCINCTQCIRMCTEVQGIGALTVEGSGFFVKVTTEGDVPLQDSPCVFCGNCITVCPTGALTAKPSRGLARTWEREKTLTVCPYCGVGCAIYLETKNGRVVGVEPANGPANENLLCVKGRFGWDFIQHQDRLTDPLIRKDGELVPVSWEEAIRYTAKKLKEYDSEALGVLSSAKCTNEENYLLQKFTRMVLGTNNIDHCARLCHASTVAALAEVFGSAAMTNSIAEIEDAKAIFIIGSNTTESHPVIGLRVKAAVRKGAALVVADPRGIELARWAEELGDRGVWLRQRPGSDVALLNGLLHVLIRDNLIDEAFVAERTEGFNEVRELVKEYTPERTARITGIPEEKLVKAAHLYGEAETASILYAMGITQHTTGTDNVAAIANLAMATGNLGKENAGVNALRGQNNVQGSSDMAALPNLLPGYRKVSDPTARKQFADAWGLEDLPSEEGLTVVKMMEAAHAGVIKAMFIMGENPMVSDPDTNHVREALNNLDFLVVSDIFLTETAMLADVVLPSASFAEREGTFTNTERRIQLIRKAIEPVGNSKSDWEIISDLAKAMGYDFAYENPKEIMLEIASLVPAYAGVRYQDLGTQGLQWPVPYEGHPGTNYLHRDGFARGKGLFKAIDFIPPVEEPDENYPLVLTTGRILYHYHTGSMSRRVEALDWLVKEGYIEIHPERAKELGVTDGELVKVSSRRGEIVTRARVVDVTDRDTVFMPFHFAEAAANVLTHRELDPKAKIPEFKVSAVRVEKVE